MKNKQHNSRRRRRDYGSTMHNLAYAMVRGDVDSVKDCFERITRYGGKMDRRDCERFLREFRAEMEEKVPSKQQRSVGMEKSKRNREMRDLKKLMEKG
jgi:hypothetical protein